ncbi:YslB family protein [Chryseomicrobium sp. FSL W7-1435]|uniref:YslB family protein n=1 Tax=Chryseomicrobium sp. FSL W7-1435 TaxID=2921704 RepID=UPI00315A2314
MEKTQEKMIPQFGYELIRDHLIANLLGKHEQEVLYWAGKDLARKFPCSSIDEIEAFFQQAGWGELHTHKSSKHEVVFHLQNSLRSSLRSDRCFKLEAGFLAEQLELLESRMTECVEDVTSKLVIFTVKSE